jgi:D-serine deaminase-like pyridoxal phosphate-dependent protein
MIWYEVENSHLIDSPSLLIYPDRVQHNINTMVQQVGGNPKRLFPHVKTHKMTEIVKMQLEVGIERFKCATISELEMVLETGAKEALIAYQMTGPKIYRLLKLAKKFPKAIIASLVDDLEMAGQLAKAFSEENLTANVYLDIDNGMHRTGLSLDEQTYPFIEKLTQIKGLNISGLHIYDGHFRMKDFFERKKGSDKAFRPVYGLLDRVAANLGLKMKVINGGSPSFSSAVLRDQVFCSPGTVLLWDAGYAEIVPELDLKWGAILLTRIISKPTPGIITVDLGHKSVAAENPITNRIRFLNLDGYEPYKHSEEHLMIKVKNWEALKVGDILYGVPYHVCPSVALHDEAFIIKNNSWVDNWNILARRRKITI